jgi:hypothetical protein
MLYQQTFMGCIAQQISENHNLLDIRKTLVYFKNEGISKDCMYACLQKLRYTNNEEVILELMDFVTGFCRSDLAIY